MTTLEEMGRLRKEVLQEQEEQKKAIKDRIQKLDGYSISDLLSLREHWVSERKSNKKLDDASIKQRREAVLWIKAIDTVLQSGKTPDAKRSIKEDDKSLVQYYIDALVRLKMSTPLLDDLERATGISKPTWSRHLNDPAFVMSLTNAIQKKLNYARKDKKKIFWNYALTGINEVIDKIYARMHHSSHSNSIDPIAQPSIPDGQIDPEVSDVMKKEMNRSDEGNSDIDESD